MKYYYSFSLANQISIILFAICWYSYQSKLFLSLIAFALLVFAVYWIYFLVTSKKYKDVTALLYLGGDIITLIMIVLHDFDPSRL